MNKKEFKLIRRFSEVLICKGFFLALLVMAILLIAGAAAAQTQYVSDELTVTMRRGEGDEYKILKLLRVGTPVQVLAQGDRHLLVKTSDGTEGYVLKQYLTEKVPDAIVANRIEKERDQLKSTLENLQGDKAGLAAKMEELNQKATELEEELAKTRQELQTVRVSYNELQEKSKNVVKLADEREMFEKENVSLTSEVKTLREENDQLLLTGVIKWFFAGAGVFFFGWMIGKISRKKKRGF